MESVLLGEPPSEWDPSNTSVRRNFYLNQRRRAFLMTTTGETPAQINSSPCRGTNILNRIRKEHLLLRHTLPTPPYKNPNPYATSSHRTSSDTHSNQTHGQHMAVSHREHTHQNTLCHTPDQPYLIHPFSSSMYRSRTWQRSLISLYLQDRAMTHTGILNAHSSGQ